MNDYIGLYVKVTNLMFYGWCFNRTLSIYTTRLWYRIVLPLSKSKGKMKQILQKLKLYHYRINGVNNQIKSKSTVVPWDLSWCPGPALVSVLAT